MHQGQAAGFWAGEKKKKLLFRYTHSFTSCPIFTVDSYPAHFILAQSKDIWTQNVKTLLEVVSEK